MRVLLRSEVDERPRLRLNPSAFTDAGAPGCVTDRSRLSDRQTCPLRYTRRVALHYEEKTANRCSLRSDWLATATVPVLQFCYTLVVRIKRRDGAFADACGPRFTAARGLAFVSLRSAATAHVLPEEADFAPSLRVVGDRSTTDRRLLQGWMLPAVGGLALCQPFFSIIPSGQGSAAPPP